MNAHTSYSGEAFVIAIFQSCRVDCIMKIIPRRDEQKYGLVYLIEQAFDYDYYKKCPNIWKIQL